MVCNDRQLTQGQREDSFDQQRFTLPAVRPFTGTASIGNIVDYLNRELVPAVRNSRNRVNEIYRQSTDNAPSGNPLQYYFSTATAAADPTSGRLRLDNATQNAASTIRLSETNARLQSAVAWLDVMASGATDPLGTVTLFDAVNPSRFLRFDLETMVDQGAYWDLGVSLIEASHDNPFVDDAAVALSFVPGVAAAGVNLRLPGAPLYDVMAPPFNAAGDGVTDDTAAINAAIAAANARPGMIFLGEAHLVSAALTSVTNNNIVIMGRGRFNGGTHIIVTAASAINVFTFANCQYSGLSNVWISATNVYTSGYGVRLREVFRPIVDNVLISQMGYGVEIYRCTLTDLWRVTLDDLYGVYGFHAYGDSGGFCHATRFVECSCATSYPAGIAGTATTWAAGQSVVAGQLRFSNGAIYQAATSGTTGASAPNGIPGATPATAHTATVSDGAVSWYFAMPLNTWFLQESYAQTFEMMDCGALQGGYGLQVMDSNPGSGSTPFFTRIFNFQVDHPFARGIRLLDGKAADLYGNFITSVQDGYGFEVASTFEGGWRWVGGEIFGCSRACVLISYGDGIMADAQLSAGGSGYSVIEVTNSASNWMVKNCIAGVTTDDPSPDTNYGIDIGAGCDNYTVTGNSFRGHVVAPIRNTPGQSTTRIIRDNMPLWANHIASDAYEAFTLAGGSTHTLTLAATTNTAFVTVSGTGTAVIDQIVHGAGNAGVQLTIVKEGTANRLALRDGNAGTNSIWTPFAVDYFLNAYNDSVSLESLAGRWRPKVPARFTVRINSTGTDYVRRRLNLIPGTGITLTPGEDSTNEELDLTIAASTGLPTAGANTIMANATAGSAIPTDVSVSANSLLARVGGDLVTHPFSTLAGASLGYATGVIDYAGTTSDVTVGAGANGTVDISTLQCGGSVYGTDASSSYSFEGFTARAEGFWFVLVAGATHTFTLFDEDGTATTTNRMCLPNNEDQTFTGGSLVIYYKQLRWRVANVAQQTRLLRVDSLIGTADASYTITPPTGATWFEIEAVGGGGGGGGADAETDGEACAGGGGGAASWVRQWVAITTGNITGVVGGNGAGGDTAGGTGLGGGNTTATYDGSTLFTATGGAGGVGTATGAAAAGATEFSAVSGGAGGTAGASGGPLDHRANGGGGMPGLMYGQGATETSACAVGGNGGASFYGGGGRGAICSGIAAAQSGEDGRAPGSGGGGGARIVSATGVATGAGGGDGKPGSLIVRFYSGVMPTGSAIS